MTIDPSSEITLCNDGSDVPSIQYNALELSRLYEAENGANIDVLAVVKETGPLAEITTKAQKQLKKRELTLVDASGYAVRCTLWGRQAETFEHHDNPVLGIKGCKGKETLNLTIVGEFNGRSLSLSFGSSIQINPDLPEAHHLRGWFDSKGNTVDFQTYAGQSGQNGAGTNSTETKCISQVSEENLGMGDKPDYFMLTGYISHIKQDNAWYPACPNDTCNKKVTDMGNEWRCEKCDASYPTPKYRVTDYSGQLWLQGFNEIAETILGQTANHMAQLKETSTPDYESVFGNALFKQFHFKVRAKSETYQDEVKMRASIVSVQPVDYVSSSKELIGMIQQFEKL
ncbi:Replication factor A protein 1 [Globomyces sp. JEL0801]|nr:Replication factor A protein 1 [Globomyces sp. JEL0801]